MVRVSEHHSMVGYACACLCPVRQVADNSARPHMRVFMPGWFTSVYFCLEYLYLCAQYDNCSAWCEVIKLDRLSP